MLHGMPMPRSRPISALASVSVTHLVSAAYASWTVVSVAAGELSLGVHGCVRRSYGRVGRFTPTRQATPAPNSSAPSPTANHTPVDTPTEADPSLGTGTAAPGGSALETGEVDALAGLGSDPLETSGVGREDGSTVIEGLWLGSGQGSPTSSPSHRPKGRSGSVAKNSPSQFRVTRHTDGSSATNVRLRRASRPSRMSNR